MAVKNVKRTINLAEVCLKVKKRKTEDKLIVQGVGRDKSGNFQFFSMMLKLGDRSTGGDMSTGGLVSGFLDSANFRTWFFRYSSHCNHQLLKNNEASSFYCCQRCQIF